MIDQWLKRSYFNIFNGKFDLIKLGKIEAKNGGENKVQFCVIII